MKSPLSTRLFAHLLGRLTASTVDHPAFKGPPIDIEGLTARELGQLWPHLQRAKHLADNSNTSEAARTILNQAKAASLTPALDEQATLLTLRDLQPGQIVQAIETLAFMDGPVSAELTQEAQRLLSVDDSWSKYHIPVAALIKLSGDNQWQQLERIVEAAFAGSEYVLTELTALKEMSFPALLSLANSPFLNYFNRQLHPDAQDPCKQLSEEAAYIEFAGHALRSAARKLADIHAGTEAYVADAAFTTDDAVVLGRAARVALIRDEVWLGKLLATLLPQTCVAPTAAKTTPAQSLAIAMGHAIESSPTPESVLALREALKVVRHAGLKKKLSRHLKPSERALAARPETALRLMVDAKPDKRRLTMLATCLEAGFWQEMEMLWGDWHPRLAGTAFGTSLVWRAQLPGGTHSFRVKAATRKSLTLADVHGQAVDVPDSTPVRLWHPLQVDEAERAGWQALVTAEHLRQPIRQVFREHYLPPKEELGASESALFSGHLLSIRPLIGLARREGWTIDRFEGLQRVFGELRLAFRTDMALYPGAGGITESGLLSFGQRQGNRWVPASLHTLPPVLFSEACRAVDLLVSTTAFAIEDESLPETRPAGSQHWARSAEATPTQMARMRRAVLQQVFSAHSRAQDITLAERHLLIGEFAIHLSTARVTRKGAPVTVEIPPDSPQIYAVPWLPYDEKLLQKIVNTASVLLGKA